MTFAKEEPRTAANDSLDQLVTDLRLLRVQAGPVSYSDLVKRIADRRAEHGISGVAATPPRSTVHSVFTLGRKRLDTDLLREIVLALGADDADAESWVSRARALALTDESRRVESALPAASAPAASAAVASRTVTPGLVLLIVVCCTLYDFVVDNYVVNPLRFPIYGDMIGVAVGAFLLGPWWGALIGATSGLVGAALPALLELHPRAWDTTWFTFVCIAGGFAWGVGVRYLKLGTSLGRFIALNAGVAIVCSVVATPILVAVYGGAYGAVGQVAASLAQDGWGNYAATFGSNVVSSLIDKLLTGFIALGIVAILRKKLRLPAPGLTILRTPTIAEP